MRPVPQTLLRRDLKTDVLIIGAGIDRRGAVKGSTPASTALLQYEIDTPLSTLANRIGRGRAERIWRRSKLALDALRERSRHLGIEADQANRDSLYIEGDVLDADALRLEGRARRQAGFESSFLGAREVEARTGIRRRAALMGYDNMSADPRRLAAGFLNASLQRGARLYAPVEATRIHSGRGNASVETDAGPTIRARSVVFATGYELPRGVPRKDHRIASTWALATRPQPRRLWAESCFIWEAATPYLYLYMRAGPNGEVICGGEDEDFSDAETRDGMSSEKYAAIEAKLGKLLPGIDARAARTWCGNFGTSRIGIPSIGPVPRMPNCYAVLGYGGNGITFSFMAAQMLRSMIEGNSDPDADLFSFSRTF